MTENEKSLRKTMAKTLLLLPEGHRRTFQLMYSHKDMNADPTELIPFEKMDWAFMQIENALKEKQT